MQIKLLVLCDRLDVGREERGGVKDACCSKSDWEDGGIMDRETRKYAIDLVGLDHSNTIRGTGWPRNTRNFFLTVLEVRAFMC